MLPALFAPGNWETDTRLTLPVVVTDRLFGFDQIETHVFVWGTPNAVELWSFEHWTRTLDALGEQAANFV